MNNAKRDYVADELETLSTPGGPLRFDSSRTTVRVFTPAQRAVRAAQIARAYLTRQVNVPTLNALAVVTAGPPGAGKTTFLKGEGFLTDNYRNIDPDEIKSMLLLRALEEGTFDDLLSTSLSDGLPLRPMELATLVHQESVAIADVVLSVCLEAGENILLQGSLGWEDSPRILLGALTENDYASLTILDVEVELSLALERSRERWWSGRHDASDVLGGRFVPESSISGLYQPDGRSRCEENAELMLVASKISNTQLIRESMIAGVASRVVKTNTNSARRVQSVEAELTGEG